jgi:uncharacterized protein (TIGR00730 family)
MPISAPPFRVCVFAGSRSGRLPAYAAAAEGLGKALACRGWTAVYGGGRAGLMGTLANAVLAGGGEVIGVIPGASASLTRELAHEGLTELHVVGSMHERKAMMHELSSAFVVLPGGFGTLDETFEAITWMQLGMHGKPIALLDVKGYWGPLLDWFERAVRDDFVAESVVATLFVHDDPERILDAVAPRPPAKRQG